MEVELDLPDELLADVRARADERGESLEDFVTAALHDALVLTATGEPPFELDAADLVTTLAEVEAALDVADEAPTGHDAAVDARDEPVSDHTVRVAGDTDAPTGPAGVTEDADGDPPVDTGAAADAGGSAAVQPPATPVDEPAAGPVVPAARHGGVTAFVGRARQGPVDEAVVVADLAGFVAVFGPPWRGSRLGPSVQTYFARGGAVAVVVRASASDGGSLGPDDLVGEPAAADGRGLHALDASRVDALVIPPYTRDGDVDPEVRAAALAWCGERHALLLADAGLAGVLARSARHQPTTRPLGPLSAWPRTGDGRSG